MDKQVKRKLGGGKRTEQPEPWKIEELVNARGEKIVSRFIATLQGRNSDEAKALLMVLAERGNELGMPESKSLGQGLVSFVDRSFASSTASDLADASSCWMPCSRSGPTFRGVSWIGSENW